MEGEPVTLVPTGPDPKGESMARMREREDYCGGREEDEGSCKRYPFCPVHAGRIPQDSPRYRALEAEWNALHETDPKGE